MASQELSGLFSTAAGELDRAAAHFRESAQHTELGEHRKASEHAFIAQGHLVTAQQTSAQAATAAAERSSSEVMQAHQVTDVAVDFNNQP